MRTGPVLNSSGAAAAAAAAAAMPSTGGLAADHSAWHSPVPYLFGGLAAMLGLIAFALLILACSYWRLSGYLEGGRGGAEDTDGDQGGAGEKAGGGSVFKDSVVVIMAGDEKPTFLATPMSSRSTSLGTTGEVNDCDKREEEKGVDGGNKTEGVVSSSEGEQIEGQSSYGESRRQECHQRQEQ